jgi:hypothetical protein
MLPAAPRFRTHAATASTSSLRQQQRAPRPAAGPCRASRSGPDAEAEARLEALEASIKGKATRSQRQIPIRGVTPPQQQQASSTYAEWKEGALFPVGWERMPLPQKVTEIYLGQRGMLFWANKAAWASSITIGVLWVLLRLVLPSLGVISLPGDQP